jgi:uncharacterized repeat protein (TIGR01451 family)
MQRWNPYETVLGVSNAGSLQVKWSFAGNSSPTSGGLYSSPAVVNGVVYIGSKDSNVYALNASTGAKQWSFATEPLEVIDNSSPAVANGVVYIGSAHLINDEGNVCALNASTGAKLWTYNTGSDILSSPAVVDGVVYVDSGLGSGLVLAFGLGPVPSADLFLRIQPTPTTVHQGDLITYAFPVWNLGPANAAFEVLNTQVPAGTTFSTTSASPALRGWARVRLRRTRVQDQS